MNEVRGLPNTWLISKTVKMAPLNLCMVFMFVRARKRYVCVCVCIFAIFAYEEKKTVKNIKNILRCEFKV